MSGWKPKSAVPVAPAGGGAWTPQSAAPVQPMPVPAPAPVPPRETTSRTAAFSRGFSQGATANTSDELLGALANIIGPAALDAPPELLKRWKSILSGGGGGLPEDSTRPVGYQENRDYFRGLNRQSQEDRPGASFAGAITGGVALGSRLPVGRLSATLQGAASGYGGSESEKLGGQAADTAVGAVLGNAGDRLGQFAGRAIPAAARNIRDRVARFAEERALKAAGYIQKDLKGMVLANPENVSRAGRVLLDEPGLIRPGERVDAIAERLPYRVEAQGDQIGRAYAEADNLGARFDMEPFLQKAEAELLDPIARDPAVRSEAAELRRLISGYREAAMSPVEAGTLGPAQSVGVPFAEAGAMKSNLQKTINFGTNPLTGKPSANAERFVKSLQGQFGDEIDRQLGQVLDDGSMASFRDSMARYGPLKEALGRAREGVAREGGNASLGLRDYIAGSSLAAASQAMGVEPWAAPLVGLGTGMVNKFIRERADSTLAVGADAVANSDWLGSIVRKNPEVLGRWGAYLSRAAAESPESLAVAHKVLSETSPEYRQQVSRATQQQNGPRQ